MNTEATFAEIRNRYSDEYYSTENSILVQGDSLELLKKIPDHSVALILTDPPYHSTKKRNIIGDTNFSKDSEYIEWMKKYAIEWKRVLKHNGSIFCFCSSTMSAQLQVMFSAYFKNNLPEKSIRYIHIQIDRTYLLTRDFPAIDGRESKRYCCAKHDFEK